MDNDTTFFEEVNALFADLNEIGQVASGPASARLLRDGEVIAEVLLGADIRVSLRALLEQARTVAP